MRLVTLKKTKEFRISFLKTGPLAIDQLTINNISLDIVKTGFKLLHGITISSHLTWSIHVDNIYVLKLVKGYMPFEF
jgi:hypothetical protein